MGIHITVSNTIVMIHNFKNDELNNIIDRQNIIIHSYVYLS